MGLTLRPDMILEPRAPEGYAALFPGTDRDAGPVFALPPVQGLVLSLLDGTRTREDVILILEEVFDRSAAAVTGVVDRVLERYRLFLTETAEEDASFSAISPAEFVFPSSRDFSATREAAPQSLSWVVTEWCNRKCRYCYKDAQFIERGTPPDLDLDFERLRELADEAFRIGVENLVLTGGEPFLRPDLIDVIRVFVERGIEVIPITKAAIGGERMAALAATGLRELHVSLDSHCPEVQDDLCGLPGSFRDILGTVAAATEYGLAVVLRPVLTRFNLAGLPALVELAYGLGVRRFLIDVYGKTCGRHEEGLAISPGDVEGLRETHRRLAERYDDASLELKFDERGPESGPVGCMEGLRGLTILPDGRATKCEHWRFGDDLVVGDLKVQSLLEVWNSAALARINQPPRESFAGTPCHRCKQLTACNDVRGRCSLTSLLAYGTPFAPDLYCPIGVYGKGKRRQGSAALRVVS
jgi:radical SAM protein with 4Fe4S-binding SPASM domain